MAPYLVTFLTVSVVSIYAERKLDENKTKSFIFLSIIAILVPSILAGCRDYTIGTDVQVYVLPTFEQARRFSNITSWLTFNATWYKSVDFLFAVLTYAISRVTDNAHFLLFAIALLIDGFFYAAWVRFRKYVPVWIGMLVWMLCYYNQSYNIMRQSIAAAILFFATSFLVENRKIAYIVLVAMAALFHNSAIIGFFFLLIPQTESKIDKVSKKYLRNGIVALVCVLFLFLPNIIQVAVSVGILPAKYIKYVAGDHYSSGFSTTLLLFSAIKIGLIFLYRKPLFRKHENNAVFFVYAMIDFLVAFLKIYSPYTSRLELFTGTLTLILFAQLPSIYRNDRTNKMIMTFIVLGYCFIYWYYICIFHGYYMTYPYIFNIQA